VLQANEWNSGGVASMQLVTTFDQIAHNVAKLEGIRRDPNGGEFTDYAGLVKRGTCFLPYRACDGIAFAPSRYIGYVGNSLTAHSANEKRDGRLTNAALNKILGQGPAQNGVLESEYLRFCSRIGISPSRTGTFGVARKYWIISDVAAQLDHIAETALLADLNITATEKEQLGSRPINRIPSSALM